MWNAEESQAPRNAMVVINEGEYEVAPGEDLASKVKEIAREKGIKNFKVYRNGLEVSTPAPSTFQAGDVVKVYPYDKAA